MARGFGATHGGGTSDRIESALTAHANQRTYALWTYRAGAGGGSLGRMIDKRSGADPEVELMLLSNAAPVVYQFVRVFSVAVGRWDRDVTLDCPVNEWHHIVFTFDSSADTNDPVMYIDGVLAALTEANTPSGTANTNTSPYVIGNRASDNARNWDGQLAEFAVWDRILSTGEIAALGKGYSPLFFPVGRVEYIPLIRDTASRIIGPPGVTGTAVQVHPRVIYPAWATRGASGVGSPPPGAPEAAGAYSVTYSRPRLRAW